MPTSIEAAVEAAHAHTRASARKTGRNPRFPYVPVLEHTNAGPAGDRTRTEQILGRAFTTRDEAATYAQAHLDRNKAHLAESLANPNLRALREYYGLPRELPAGAR